MNILSSPLWPSDMPDERRVIALLGLVQISEDKMSLVQAVEQMEEEIERLNALVSMQAEALKKALNCVNVLWVSHHANRGDAAIEAIESALSATAETVSAWQSKRDNEIREKQLSELADEAERNGNHILSMQLAGRASELRAKGE